MVNLKRCQENPTNIKLSGNYFTYWSLEVMKSKWFFSCFLLWIGLGVSGGSGSMMFATQDMLKSDMDALIEEIADHFAPDGRVALFDVSWRGEDPVVLTGETNLVAARDSLINRLTSAKIDYRDSIQILIARPGLVTVSVCNIRSKPQHSAELSTQSLMGTPLKVFKEKSGWTLVQTPDHYLGWLDEGAFVVLSETAMEKWQKDQKIVVNAAYTFVQSETGEGIISDVVSGNILRKIADLGDHIAVQLPDGRGGVIRRSEVMDFKDFISPREDPLASILKTAHSFLGRPYLWGGTSSKAMDCSGFTKTVFYLNGFQLPRDASQQVHVGSAIETDTTLKNLQPGDFLFFGKEDASGDKARITHVAIYLGQGKMIHASQMVRIQSLRRGDPDFAENRLKTLVGARRMIGTYGENGVEPLNLVEAYQK